MGPVTEFSEIQRYTDSHGLFVRGDEVGIGAETEDEGDEGREDQEVTQDPG